MLLVLPAEESTTTRNKGVTIEESFFYACEFSRQVISTLQGCICLCLPLHCVILNNKLSRNWSYLSQYCNRLIFICVYFNFNFTIMRHAGNSEHLSYLISQNQQGMCCSPVVTLLCKYRVTTGGGLGYEVLTVLTLPGER